MKRVAISTLGCKTNQFESAAMLEQLQAAGYRIVPFNEQSDIYIINSCTVTARTDAETRRLIRRARRLNGVTYCYRLLCKVAPGELKKCRNLTVYSATRRNRHPTLLESGRNSVSDIATISHAEPLKLTSFAEHTRAFLQIQNGCNSFCSYCIVPYARGRSRSVTSHDILRSMREFAANGFKEVVLTGIHLGAYGLDFPEAASLTALVREIVGENIVPRLRIGSIEPNEVTDELLELMTSSASICPHLHLPCKAAVIPF
jgi:threonylcarbamoyladenosine tRNA methylthiotransferase MtaB